MTVATRLALAAAVIITEIGAVACSLDFDRFSGGVGDGSAENAMTPSPMSKGGTDATSDKTDSGSGAQEASPAEETAAA
jgi:hypothetical protein